MLRNLRDAISSGAEGGKVSAGRGVVQRYTTENSTRVTGVVLEDCYLGHVKNVINVM